MSQTYRELGFDALLVIGSGIALSAYMLGIILDPIPAAAVGIILVVLGVLTLVPPEARVPAALLGLLAVGLAGIVVPRVVETIGSVPIANELVVSLLASGLILLLTFALLRLTAFQKQTRDPV